MRARSFRHLLLPVSLVLVSAACGARTGISVGEREDAGVVPDASAEAGQDAAPDAPTCKAKRRACYTTAELIDLWNHPPETGHRDGGPPPIDPNGCMPSSAVLDDCCNPAFDGPTVEADLCCYDFCGTSCCDGLR